MPPGPNFPERRSFRIHSVKPEVWVGSGCVNVVGEGSVTSLNEIMPYWGFGFSLPNEVEYEGAFRCCGKDCPSEESSSREEPVGFRELGPAVGADAAFSVSTGKASGTASIAGGFEGVAACFRRSALLRAISLLFVLHGSHKRNTKSRGTTLRQAGREHFRVAASRLPKTMTESWSISISSSSEVGITSVTTGGFDFSLTEAADCDTRCLWLGFVAALGVVWCIGDIEATDVERLRASFAKLEDVI